MSDLTLLLEAIRTGQAERLDRTQVHDLLAWLGRGRSEAGSPDQDPVLQQMVLFRLDAVLFRDGSLDLAAAGVDSGVPDKERKARFRRLASVFHPDRFPALADWLTLRSQAVHTAYTRFKKDPESVIEPPTSAPSRHYPSRPQSRSTPPTRPPKRPGFVRRHLLHLRRRYGHDRYLPHKLIGGLAVVALLPVLNLLLAPAPSFDGSGLKGPQDQGTGSRASIEAPDRSVDGVAGADRATSNPGEDVKPIAALAGEGGAGAERDPSEDVPADRAGPGAAGSAVTSLSEQDPVSSLSRAARDALGSNSSDPALRQSVDAQLAALGLPTDDERLNRRVESGRTDSGVSRPPKQTGHPNSHPSAQAATTTPATAPENGQKTSRPDAVVDPRSERRPARIASTDNVSPPEVPQRARQQTQSEAPPREQETSEPDEPRTDRIEPVTPDSSRFASERKENSRPDSPASGQVTANSGDAFGDGTGANSDRGNEFEPESALANRQIASAKGIESADSAPTPVDDAPPSTPSSPDDGSIVSPAPTEQIAEATGPRDETPSAPGNTENAMTNAPPEPGRLALGPLGFHPAGDVLTDFKVNVEAGDILALRALFGDQRAVDRFVRFIEISTARAVDMEVHRMQRHGSEWLIELDMQLRSADQNRDFPNATFRLAQQNDRLRIIGVDQ
jgi:hypothetical protein